MVGFWHWVYIPHTFGTSSLGSGILPLTKGYSFLPFSAHSSGNITTTGMTLGRLGTSIVGNVVRPSRKSNMAISPKRCKSWRRQELSRATQLSRLRSQGDAWPQTEGEASTGVKRKQPGLTLWMYYDVLMIYIYIFLVGDLEHDFYDFPYLGNGKSSQLLLTPSFFRGVGIPPSRYILNIRIL